MARYGTVEICPVLGMHCTAKHRTVECSNGLVMHRNVLLGGVQVK